MELEVSFPLVSKTLFIFLSLYIYFLIKNDYILFLQ